MADYGVRITLAAASPIPTYTGGPWVSGVAKLSSSSGASGWSSGILIEVSALGEQVDIASGGNYASVSDVDVVLFAGWVPAFETAGASMYGATVEVGTLSGTTLTVRWSGVVSDIGWRGSELQITAESVITLRHREIPARILSGDEFAALPNDAEGQAVPILYGAVERLTPVSLQSDRDYLAGQAVYMGTNPVPIYRSTTMIATPYGSASPTATMVPVVWKIYTGRDDLIPPDDYTADNWFDFDLILSGTMYMEIFQGAGQGQTRKVSGVATAYVATIGGASIFWAEVPLASPLDVLPDATSGFRFYVEATGAVLAIGDEATTVSVTVELDGKTYPIGYTPGTVEDVATADVSAEFASGEDYAALEYFRPSEVFGNSALSDGLTASGGTAVSVLPIASGDSPSSHFDQLCHGEIYTQDLTDSVLSETTTGYIMYAITTAAAFSYEVTVLGERWTGTVDELSQFESLPFASTSRSTYTSAIFPDGTPGNFSSFAIALDSLPVPLRSYRRLKFCVSLVGTGLFVDDLGAATWTNGATSVTVNDANGATALGRRIRPYVSTGAGTAFDDARIRATRAGVSNAYGGNAEDWRTVTAVTPLGGTTYRLDFATPIAVATGDYFTISAAAADFVTVTEREAGIAFSYGAISPDSTFIASVSQGRTFDTHWPALPPGKSNGDPITEAAHVAQDIFLRDLAIPQADIGASYLTVPAYTARVALVEQEDSASVLARMCREFNWVGAHDNAGRETLVAWLDRLYTASADYAVTNAEIVEDSIDGVDATSLDDIVTLPRVSWDWTQADGYRGAGTVTDCSADPSTITPSNYLRTISGFGDYSTALAAYEVLNEAWSRNGVRRSATIEYRYGGNPTDLYLPALLAWAASRKDILRFKLNETHAAASAYLGQRISVTHKRYTGGGTVYGTLVARYWFPADGQIQLTVMLDPVAFAVDNLYVDTIDPTATIDQYIDQVDGVSDQYTDTLGA